MDLLDMLDAFELHDQLVLNQQIDPVPAIENHAFILYRHWVLRYRDNVVALQLTDQTPPIRGFQQPRPEYAVHLDGTANHPV
jgi:hypothetical protein